MELLLETLQDLPAVERGWLRRVDVGRWAHGHLMQCHGVLGSRNADTALQALATSIEDNWGRFGPAQWVVTAFDWEPNPETVRLWTASGSGADSRWRNRWRWRRRRGAA